MKAFCVGMECVTAVAVTKWNDGTKGGGLIESLRLSDYYFPVGVYFIPE
jgi:hypothetical protein